MRLKASIFLLVNVLILNFASAQLLDDSTKLIYGPKSTKFFLEKDVYNNIATKTAIDTVLQNFHLNYLEKRKNNYLLQDLGNNGTASKLIFMEANSLLGTQFGSDVFLTPRFDLSNNKFYDTKSPFSEMQYIQGGRGQDLAKFTHAQNINKRLNIGIDLQNFASSKAIGTPLGRDDRIVKNWNIQAHSNFTSKNSKYLILSLFNKYSQFQIEQGGILPTGGDTPDNTFRYNFERVKMGSASNIFKALTFHNYQQYRINKAFTAFHIFDFEQTSQKFKDISAVTSKENGFYQNLSGRSFPESRRDTIGFINFDNKLGIKGNFKGYNYRLTIRNRIWSAGIDTTKRAIKGEIYLGGWAAYYFKDSVTKLTSEVEFGVNQNFYFLSNLFSKFGMATFLLKNQDASFIQSNFGRIYQNNNQLSPDFKFIRTTELTIKPIVTLGKSFLIDPFLKLTNITNYIYLDANVRQVQSSKPVQLLRIGFESKYNFKKYVLQNAISFNSSSNLIRVPRIVFDATFSKEFLISKKLKSQAGLHLNYMTAYFADGYDPQSAQFHLQNALEVQGKPVFDAFINMKLSKVRFFFTINNFLNIPNSVLLGSRTDATTNKGWQNLINNLARKVNNGYFSTPTYTALPMNIGFGINWPLFD